MLGDTAARSDSSTIQTACARLVGQTLEVVERELIIQTLRCHAGNRTHAAHVLGISVRALRNKIRVYRDGGQDVPDPEPSSSGARAICRPDAAAFAAEVGAGSAQQMRSDNRLERIPSHQVEVRVEPDRLRAMLRKDRV